MSTLKVDTITDSSSGLTTTINGFTPQTSNMAGRNLIINGAMQVAQRGTVSFNDANGYGGPDRFMSWVNGTTGTISVSQSNNAPDGFANSCRIETTSAGNFNAASSYQIWGQLFEGQNLQGLAFGTSSAKTVTASFWVRSSQTGIMNIEFRNVTASRHNISQYTINSANTWEYKTITFTGDTASGFANSNALGAYLIHWGKGGSTFNTGTAPTSGWVGLSNGNFAAGATLDYISGVGRYIEFTGIQLEIGDTATPFEHRSYGEELALCQRYYEKFVIGSSGTPLNMFLSAQLVTNNSIHTCYFKVTKRASPSWALIGGTGWGGTAPSNSATNTDFAVFQAPTASYFYLGTQAGHGITFDSEL